ncbi:hypothetical protein ACFSRY_16625 [Pontibacter locisalis]|uniref:STAS/SEC14 domain-containing protein n=1 Tax=Pontibacter locisalis TaxID=1719035 RepID=A0ABW5IS44_9BACT
MEGHYLSEANLYPASNYSLHKDYLNKKLSLAFEPCSETLVIKWAGAVSSEEIRAGYKAILKLVEEIKPHKWIIDVHQREQIKSQDQQWVLKNIFSQALRLLCRDIFVAVVLPVQSYQTLVSELNGDEFIFEGNLLIINHFLYEEEGRRWLEDVTLLNKI